MHEGLASIVLKNVEEDYSCKLALFFILKREDILLEVEITGMLSYLCQSYVLHLVMNVFVYYIDISCH